MPTLRMISIDTIESLTSTTKFSERGRRKADVLLLSRLARYLRVLASLPDNLWDVGQSMVARDTALLLRNWPTRSPIGYHRRVVSLKRREQVFVSSTYVDLKEERQAVSQMLLKLNCFPSGMELFPASDDDSWTLIRRVIDESDYYLVVVGGRYGSMNSRFDLSYTEMEFDYALQKRKPVVAFLHRSPEDIPQRKIELAANKRKRLEAFRRKLQEHGVVAYWSTPEDLNAEVAVSLVSLRNTHPAVGWVRGEVVATPEVLADRDELRLTVDKLREELQQLRADPVDSLASGTDQFTIGYTLRYWTHDQNVDGLLYPENAHTFSDAVRISWNDIFLALCPALAEGATECELEEELGAFVRKAVAVTSDRLPSDFAVASRTAEIDGGTIRQVRSQLLLLRVVTESSRRRTFGGDPIWVLTSDGRAEAMRLEAVPKPPPDHAT